MKQYRPQLSEYPHRQDMSTRWSDNDQYGHLNNAIYYQLYDAVVNAYMMEHCGWHPHRSGVHGLVVSSSTEYFEIVHGFPTPVTLGLKVTKLGKSSVEYEIGLFQDSQRARAVGRFVHVFVDKSTDKTMPQGMPAEIRKGLAKLVVAKDDQAAKTTKPKL